MKTVIYLVRHGESIGNMHRVILGHTDVGLSDLGKEQAVVTARELAGVKFDAIYSSDLSRAMNTALPHAELRGMNVIPDEGLREIYLGEWENLYVDDVIRDYGELFTVSWRFHFGEFQPPAGEAVPDLAKRIYDTVKRIAAQHLGETLLIASHAGAIRAFWGLISKIPAAELAAALPFPSNASYSVVEYDSETGELVPISFSNDAHLADMLTTWKD